MTIDLVLIPAHYTLYASTALKNVCNLVDGWLMDDDLFDQLILIFDVWFLIAWVLDACGCYFSHFSIG